MVRCWECFFNDNLDQVDRNRCFPGGDVKYIAEYWYETNKAISDFTKSITSNRIFLIKEEELIKQPEKVLADCYTFLDLPINLPKHMIAKIDWNRNELWSKRLSNSEINSLLNFVHECGDTLNSIFPEDNLFARYNESISANYQSPE